MAYEVGPEGAFTLPGDTQNPRNGVSARHTQGASEDPYERRVKKCQVGQVQGDRLSLTGSRSCTTDSINIDGRNGGLGTGQAGQRMGRKGQTANAFH